MSTHTPKKPKKYKKYPTHSIHWAHSAGDYEMYAGYNQDLGPSWGKPSEFDGIPLDELSADQRFIHDMTNMIGVCQEMLAVIEGGEAREDFETFPALHHFGEVENFLENRIKLLKRGLKAKKQLKKIKKLLGLPAIPKCDQCDDDGMLFGAPCYFCQPNTEEE